MTTSEVPEEMQTLELNLHLVAQYAAAFPDEYAGVRLNGQQIEALFTRAEPHASALAQMESSPDAIRVVVVEHSQSELVRLQEQVREMLRSELGLARPLRVVRDLTSVHAHVPTPRDRDKLRELLSARGSDPRTLRITVGDDPDAPPQPVTVGHRG